MCTLAPVATTLAGSYVFFSRVSGSGIICISAKVHKSRRQHGQHRLHQPQPGRRASRGHLLHVGRVRRSVVQHTEYATTAVTARPERLRQCRGRPPKRPIGTDQLVGSLVRPPRALGHNHSPLAKPARNERPVLRHCIWRSRQQPAQRHSRHRALPGSSSMQDAGKVKKRPSNVERRHWQANRPAWQNAWAGADQRHDSGWFPWPGLGSVTMIALEALHKTSINSA